jgi:hypothetical protein
MTYPSSKWRTWADISADRTLDDLRNCVKEKRTNNEAYLSSQSTAKPGLVTKSDRQITDSLVHDNSLFSKMKIKLVTDMIKNIPLLEDTDPEKIFKFFMSVKGAYDLNLVIDFKFITLLVSRTPG